MGGAILTFIVTVLPGLLWFVLRTLGVGVVSYVGLDIVMDQLSSWILTNMDGLPSDALNLIALSGVDVSVKIVISAYVTGFSIQSALGSFKGFRVK